MEIEVPGAMYGYLEKVCEAMRTAGEGQVIDGKTGIVWTGFTTHLMKELEVPAPYYGHILDAMQRMGCAQQTRRGGGTSPSQWVLWKDPTPEEYVKVRMAVKGRPRGNSMLEVNQRIASIEQRLGGLDVGRALADMALEIKLLKEKVDARP